MKINVLLLASCFAIFGYAASFASNLTGPEGGWMNKTLTGPTTRNASTPIAGALLLEDGVSILLLEDGSSHFCLEGGC